MAVLITGVGCDNREHAADGTPPEPRAPRHEVAQVVLITVDTLRADALGTYGAEPSATPHIDAFASRARVFERAVSPMPLTRPSHFSMLTSLHPREHGVVNNRIALPPEHATLARRMRDAGYRSAAFVSVALLAPGSGAEHGFEHFSHPLDARERSCEPVVDEALRWIDGLADDEDFFLWLHLFDPHLPYRGTEDENGEAPSLGWQDLERIASEHGGDVPREVLDRARRLYGQEASRVDRCVGRLLAAVDGRRPPEQSLVVLTADHGECFERGIYFEHADCLLEGATRVPLIVRHPPRFPAGREPSPVGLIDVAPTILAVSGLEPLARTSGRLLFEAAATPQRRLLVQHPMYNERMVRNRSERRRHIRSVAGDPTVDVLTDAERVGLVGTDWKYLRSAGQRELYRLSPTTDEGENRIDLEPEVASELDRALDETLSRHALTVIDPGEINDALRDALVALGYADPDPN